MTTIKEVKEKWYARKKIAGDSSRTMREKGFFDMGREAWMEEKLIVEFLNDLAEVDPSVPSNL